MAEGKLQQDIPLRNISQGAAFFYGDGKKNNLVILTPGRLGWQAL